MGRISICKSGLGKRSFFDRRVRTRALPSTHAEAAESIRQEQPGGLAGDSVSGGRRRVEGYGTESSLRTGECGPMHDVTHGRCIVHPGGGETGVVEEATVGTQGAPREEQNHSS